LLACLFSPIPCASALLLLKGLGWVGCAAWTTRFETRPTCRGRSTSAPARARTHP
jgi:hypothetical protein